MATAQSFADKIRSWEKALAGYGNNAEALASADPQRQALEQILAKARELKNQQESFIAAKQQLTKEINELMEDGEEAARRLRAAAKANLGTKNERLVQFDVTPIRPRTRKPKEEAPEEPTVQSKASTVKPAAAEGGEQ